MSFRRCVSFALATACAAAVGCAAPATPKTASSAVDATGEWVSGPVDLRKLTAVVRVTPPARLKSTMEQMAARTDDEDFGDFLRAHASGGFGSGFVVVHRASGGTRAFVVTNRHVVSSATDAEVSFSDGTTYKACEIVFVSPKHDLAVLALPDSAVQTFGYGLRPRDAETAERLPVVATGYPGVGGAPSYQVTDGKVSNARFTMPELGFDDTLLQHTAPIDPGSSGGPLTDESGRLVGVTVMLMRKRSSMFFAVPAAAVTETVREAHALTQQRTQASWMKSELEKTCNTLSAELSSASAAGPRLMPFVSNQLVADSGIESYAFMTRTKSGPALRRIFFEEPMVALRASVMMRVAIRTELGGGAAGGCAQVHPGDEAALAEGKRVRLSVKTRKGDMELAWTFEQGAWRIAGGDLMDVRAMLEEEARPAPVAQKPAKASRTVSKGGK
jgi:serine protease Do